MGSARMPKLPIQDASIESTAVACDGSSEIKFAALVYIPKFVKFANEVLEMSIKTSIRPPPESFM